jgi:hypothetical protein
MGGLSGPATMRRSFRNPIRRAVAIGFILLGQLQILWVAAVHQHEPWPVPQSAKIQAAGSARQPSPESSNVLCPACQIIRHNAARTSAGMLPPPPRVWVGQLAGTTIFTLLSWDSLVTRGRSPPLS